MNTLTNQARGKQKEQVGEGLLASLWLSSARDFSDLLVSPCLSGSSGTAVK